MQWPYLPRVRIDSEDVIDRLFSEIRDTALRGTKDPTCLNVILFS